MSENILRVTHSILDFLVFDMNRINNELDLLTYSFEGRFCNVNFKLERFNGTMVPASKHPEAMIIADG